MELLKQDAETVREFGIDEQDETDLIQKLGYARTQLEEIKKGMWRQRVDLLIAQQQLKHAEDDTMKMQWQSKVGEHKMMLRQFVRSVKVLNALVPELEQAVKG